MGISAYPTSVPDWENIEIEENMSTVFQTILGVRSLRSTYNLPNNVKPTVYITCVSEETKNVIESQLDDIKTLGKLGEIVLVSSKEEVPPACGINVVNEAITVNM